MRTIEAKLHDILLDLFPDQFNSYNQAKIVAEAADLFVEKSNKKTASVNRNGETGLVKALWAALSSLGLDEDFEDQDSNYVDGFGLDPNQIIRSAVSQNNKYNLKLKKLSMEVLNDSELDVFLNEEIENEYNLDDATDEELHPAQVYKSPGDAKHHTDSRVTPG
jgi:hypothetical protein